MSSTERPSRHHGMPPLSRAEALTTVLVGCAAVDGILRAEEARRLHETLASTRFTFGAGTATAAAAASRALDLIANHGLDVVMAAAAAAIPAEFRPTVFTLAIDVALSDGRLGSREAAMIDRLQPMLQIEAPLAQKIVDVILIKNRAGGRPDQ